MSITFLHFFLQTFGRILLLKYLLYILAGDSLSFSIYLMNQLYKTPAAVCICKHSLSRYTYFIFLHKIQDVYKRQEIRPMTSGILSLEIIIAPKTDCSASSLKGMLLSSETEFSESTLSE